MATPNLEGLSLHEEEEEGFVFDFDEEGEEQVNLQWCLVGRFLCERPIHFNSMKVRMAELWRPVRGVNIKEAKSGLFLFSFAHPLDMEAVFNGGPWSFDNNTLIMERVQIGMQIENIPLFHTDFWVQVHNLPMGLMKETVGVKLANYIGSFLEYDKNNNTCFWRQHMRIRVKVDVRQPLKKDTKVKDKTGGWCTVNFKYEKLGVFCFVCGIMGHAENKCEVRFYMENDDGRRDWSGEIRADPQRMEGRQTSRWLRDDRGGGEGGSGGDRRSRGGITMGVANMGPVHADVSSATHDQPTQPNNALIVTNTTPNGNHDQPINVINLPLIHSETDQIIQTSRQPLTLTETEIIPHLITTQPIIKAAPVLSTNYHNLLPMPNNQSNPPLFTSNPINSPSLLHNYPLFNSQPNLSLPIKIPNRKQLISQKTKKAKQNTRLEINPTQTQTNHNSIEPTLNQNRTNPVTRTQQLNCENGGDTDMEVQTEKKRRREVEENLEKNDHIEIQHFLSAGPGRQDCRE
jgi:14-3-3 protein epsilon